MSSGFKHNDVSRRRPAERRIVSDGRLLSRSTIPRLILHTFVWLLLSRLPGDTLPFSGFVIGFATAIFAAGLVELFDIRTLSSLLIMALLPWIVRLVIPGLSRVAFDNVWLLLWPIWYAGGFLFLLGTRYHGFSQIEIVLLILSSGLLLGFGGDWHLEVPSPVLATIRLGAAALVLVVGAWALASRAVSRDGGAPKSERGQAGRPKTGGWAMFLFLILLALLVVVLLIFSGRLRREKSISEGGGVLTSNLFQFDFNDVLSLEPEISLKSELTLLYREDGRATTRYLRRFTLSGWDSKRGFFRDTDNEPGVPGAGRFPESVPKGPLDRENPEFLARTPIRQEYYLIAIDPSSLFVLDYPLRVEPWEIWDDASFSRAYAVDSSVSIAGPWELFDAEELAEESTEESPGGEEWIDYYTAGGEDGYYRDLAEEITRGAIGGWEKAYAIENWFLDNFYYSLKPGLAPDGDQLSWFLEETRRGYCSYFAFAMTRLTRAAGIPSRVAVGFLSDPETATMGFTPVRADQAHAWVEIWVEGYGWINFDPTSSEMAPGEEYPLQFLSPDEWLPLIEEVLTRRGEISVSIDDGEQDRDEPTLWYQNALIFVRRNPVVPFLLLVLLFIGVYFPGRILPWVRRLAARQALRQLVRRMSDSRHAAGESAHTAGEPPGVLQRAAILRRTAVLPRVAILRRTARREWAGFASRLLRAGFTPGAKETVLDWARRLEDGAFPGITAYAELYQKALYSPVFSLDDLSEARLRSEALRPLWRSLPWRKRIRAFVHPAWPRRSR